jgi:hypothetical protein
MKTIYARVCVERRAMRFPTRSYNYSFVRIFLRSVFSFSFLSDFDLFSTPKRYRTKIKGNARAHRRTDREPIQTRAHITKPRFQKKNGERR